jgi:hypothetical protein
MKRLVVFVLVMGIAVSLFAQTGVPEYQFASGSWNFIGPRLHQSDANARLAKVNLRVPQSGPMVYEFNVQYESGLEDGHGGFGIHVFADSSHPGTSWGSGRSYLLWLNYDENPLPRSGIPRGFSAQVYKSLSNSRMDLVESVDLNEFLPFITWEDIMNPVPIKIEVDGNTGEVRVFDPSDPQLRDYFYLNLPRADFPMRGNWVALRTNGIRLSFGID